MTKPNADIVNINYGNSGNVPNPVFKDAIQRLIDSNFYTSALDPSIPNNSSRNFLATYSNASGLNKAVPLEVIVDCITRSVLNAYNSGFNQGSPIDGATGIKFSILPTELPSTAQTTLSTCSNVHEALVLLATEITLMKLALTSLGKPIPPSPKIPSLQLVLDL